MAIKADGIEVRWQVTTTPVESTVPFIDLGDLRTGGQRLEVRLDFGGGVVLTIARG